MGLRVRDTMLVLVLGLLCGTFLPIDGNLLAGMNPDLEIDESDPGFVWVANKPCVLQTIDFSHTGESSLKVTDRSDETATPRVTVNSSVLQPDHSYFFSVYVKWLNNPDGAANFNASIAMRYNNIDAGGWIAAKIAWLRFQRSGTGWLQMGGDFRLPPVDQTNYDQVQFYLQLPSDVDFMFDTAHMIGLPRIDPVEWKTEKDDKIKRERTNTIKVTGVIPKMFDPADVEIKVDQVFSTFKFGSAVKVNDFNDETSVFSANYRKYFYENCDIAVPENEMKWGGMEYRKDEYQTDRIDSFLAEMDKRGIPVRAHTVLWGSYTSQPGWLLNFTADAIVDPDTLSEEVDTWIDWLCAHYGDRFLNWDVYNEYVHGHIFEDILGKQNYVETIFLRVAARCKGDLFINDYNVLRDGIDTIGHVNLAKSLIAKGRPIGGIGAQTHIRAHHFDIASSIEFVEHRLKLLCDVNLPVVVTELSVHHDDVLQRAHKLEQVLRLFYSEPCVESVLLWGYSSENSFADDMALTEGVDLVPNAAGDVWHSLTQHEWKTHETIIPTSSQVLETIKGYHGDYSVTVSYKGDTIMTTPFKLTKGQDVSVDINLEVNINANIGQHVAQ